MQSETEIRAGILSACHRLVEEGLVSRTWGNISARLDNTHFIITPSGRDYMSLTEEDLVAVEIGTLSYEGEIKPSSEKGIHAEIYAARPEINFVIHTHQFYASVISAEAKDADAAKAIGAVLAAYALPGTSALRKNFAAALRANPDACEFLLARHGAVIFGANADEAFKKAADLENRSRQQYEKNAGAVSGAREKKPWLDDYAQLLWGRNGRPADDAEAAEIISQKNAAAARYVRSSRPLPFYDALLQRLVYKFKYSKLK